MSILDPETIDLLWTSSEYVALAQFDPVEWGGEITDEEHLDYPQAALNTCLIYCQSGQLEKENPEHGHLPVQIILVPAHPHNEAGQTFIDYARQEIERAGMQLILAPEMWNHALDELADDVQ